MDAYPWAVPTQEQMRMFDALHYEEQILKENATQQRYQMLG